MVKETQAKADKEGKFIEGIIDDSRYLAAAVSIFKKAKLYKVDTILDLLNINIKDQLEKMSSPYKAVFVSQKMDSRGKKALDQLSIDVYNGYVWVPLELISGGQEDQIGVAILLSIFKTAHDMSGKSINCLFLDEPFGQVSSTKINGIVKSVFSLAKDLGASSIKMVTHRTDFDEQLVDHILEVTSEDGISILKELQ